MFFFFEKLELGGGKESNISGIARVKWEVKYFNQK
jgi:hypothetical protein